MAGRDPDEAVRAFLAPIQAAVGAFGTAKVLVDFGGRRLYEVGRSYSWSLNDGRGLVFPDGQTFFAAMWWDVIEDARDGHGPVRVTTTGYDYSLVDADDAELWAHHWHPTRPGNVREPHIHLGPGVLSPGSPVTNKSHLPSGRCSLEHALAWAAEAGCRPQHADWRERLAEAEAPHLLYRTWSSRRQS